MTPGDIDVLCSTALSITRWVVIGWCVRALLFAAAMGKRP